MSECPRYLELTLKSVREADRMEADYYSPTPVEKMGVWPRNRRNGYPISGDALTLLRHE